jgi:small subunit ribosomal protein S8
MTDPIADMLTRIRNALASGKSNVAIPYSNLKNTVLQQFLSHGFVLGIEVKGEGVTKQLIVTLQSESQPARIISLSRVSRPGQRIYAKSVKIPKSRSGRGIFLVSTSKGIISDVEARNQKLGGELICQIY